MYAFLVSGMPSLVLLLAATVLAAIRETCDPSGHDGE